MRRRDFIALLGGTVVGWPLVARAQQPAMPVIGFLSGVSADAAEPQLAAFRQGLKETGYVEGHNVAIAYRWAEGHYDRVPALATDLVRRQVAVIVTGGGGSPALSAKAATQTIPIVSLSADDPVKAGLVASLSRPGGNLTGVNILTFDLVLKRLELFIELMPKASEIGLLVNPNSSNAEPDAKAVQDEAGARRLRVQILRAGSESEIDAAFASLAQRRPDVLLVDADAFFNARRDQLVTLAARHSIPAIYEWREFVAVGGLMSYGTRVAEAYRQVGIYTGMILKGARPADLPFMQVTKVELVVNLKTAKVLGLAIPPSILARADEVIE